MFPLNYFLPIEITQVHFQMGTKTKNRNNHEHKAKYNSYCSHFNSALHAHNLQAYRQVISKQINDLIPDLHTGQ